MGASTLLRKKCRDISNFWLLFNAAISRWDFSSNTGRNQSRESFQRLLYFCQSSAFLWLSVQSGKWNRRCESVEWL